MTFEVLQTFIQTTGFPIAACVFMYWQNTKNTEAINELRVVITELTTLIKEGKQHEH